jgi:hypothetical protein
MKVSLRLFDGGPARSCTVPYEGSRHVLPEGACPKCKSGESPTAPVGRGGGPFKVQGHNPRRGPGAAAHDEYHSDAECCACGERVGTLVVKVSTVFGIEEDERVLAGPWKVF